MPVSINDFSPHDQQIWDDELQDFVPDRVFDAHNDFKPSAFRFATPASPG